VNTHRSVLTLAAIALASTAAPAQAWCRMVTGQGRQPSDLSTCAPLATPDDHYLFWTHRCSELSISSAMPPHFATIAQVQGVFAEAAATWNATDCGMGISLSPQFDIAILQDTNACTHAGHNTRGNNVNSVIFVPTATEWATRGWDSRAFAVTLDWHIATTGEIVDVDMELDESRGRWTICDPTGCTYMGVLCDPYMGCSRQDDSPNGSPVDLQNVITHEMGHYLGLGHTTADHMDAVMYASAPFGQITKRYLTADDVAGLCAAYPPGSLPATCNREPVGGLSLDCQAHDCGCGVPGAGSRDDTAPFVLGLVALAIVRRRSVR
jgi:hypothetical protein